jgi:multidrug efflux pump subunit AcrA (membrane-fusion protein)
MEDETKDRAPAPGDEPRNATGDQTIDHESADPDGPKPDRRLLWGAIVVIGAAVLIGVAILIYVRYKKANETTTTEEPVVSVKVAKAERTSISSEISAPGTVSALTQSTVSSTISAQIVSMRQLKNVVVQKGEVLAVLASQDLRAQRDEAQAALNEARLNLETLQRVTVPQIDAQAQKDVNDAKAALDNARATYNRRAELYRQGGISLKELEASQLTLTNAENAFRLAQQNAKLNKSAVQPNARAIAEAKIGQAQARLSALQAQANQAEIKAPITGMVIDQFQFEGEMASSGAKLLTIADLSQVIVKAQFADAVVATLKTGDAVTVTPAVAPDERLSGQVTLISRSSDPQNRAVEVWATFGNPRGLLVVGGAAEFNVTNETVDDAVVIPLAGVTLDATTEDTGIVMVVGADLMAHETKVKIGIKQGEQVQIVEGLSGGETVVIEGNYGLPDGTKVEIAKDEPADGEGGAAK